MGKEGIPVQTNGGIYFLTKKEAIPPENVRENSYRSRGWIKIKLGLSHRV
jgi:hypothetical protein